MNKIEFENGSVVKLVESDNYVRGGRSSDIVFCDEAIRILDFYKRIKTYKRWIHMITYSKKKRIRNKYVNMAANNDEFARIFLGE